MNGNGGIGTEEIAKVIGHLGDEANTRMVFGEPEMFGERAIIPVAKVSYGAGGGFGGPNRAREEDTEAPTGEGMGGGFGVSAKPIGAIEVGEDSITWSPVIDWNQIALTWSRVLGVAVLMGLFRMLFLGRRRPVEL
jgi:uncharacterized spore protein YtfJ